MFYHGKNVLIVGGDTRFGHSLIRKLLDQDAHVRATTSGSHDIDVTDNHLEIVTCDLTDQDAIRPVFEDMDIVFLAAYKSAGVKVMKTDSSSLFMHNIDLQPKLIHMAATARVQRVGFVSSSYVYPYTGKPNIESEGFQGDPLIPTNYGIGWCYRYLETLCKHFHMTTKTDYAIIRPSAYYGPYDNFSREDGHVIPASIVKAIERMDPYEVWGDGNDVRSFIYVDDLIEGFMATVESYPVAEPINICARDTHTIKDVVRIILDHVGFSPRIVFSTDQPSAAPYIAPDPGRARELLNWEDKISLEEGLKRTIDWYIEWRTLHDDS